MKHTKNPEGPFAYQRAIIERFIGKDNMKAFNEEYLSNRIRHHYEKRISDTDRMILTEYRKGALENELGKKYKRTASQIRSAIYRAAREI